MNANYKHFMCRLCLCKSGTLSDIHGCKVGSGLIAAAVISDLLQLEVSATDCYPQLVCLVCLKKLFDFRSFKDSCWKAKFNFDSFYSNEASPDVHGLNGMCDSGVNTMINHGDSMETNEEYSDLYVEEINFIPEIDVNEEPIEESDMSDPLILDSSDSNGEEISEEVINIKEEEIQESDMMDPLRLDSSDSSMEEISEEVITIKEEEIQINGRLPAKEVPVTIEEDKIIVNQAKSDTEIEDFLGPSSIKMPDSSSTKDLCREISSLNSSDYNSNLVNTKELKENHLIKETIGPTGINNTLSSSMLLVPVKFLAKLNAQGKNQKNNHPGKATQNDGTAVNEMEMGEEGKSSATDGKETEEKGGKNLIQEVPNVRKNKAMIPSVQYFCQKCCKKYSSMSDLLNHDCATEAVNIFDCKVCGKTFETEKILWNHTRKHDWNINLFCQICGKGFLREEYLSMHLASHKISSSLQPVTASNYVFSIPSVETVSDTGQIEKSHNQEELVSNGNVATNSKRKRGENKLRKSKNGSVCPVCGGMYSTSYTLKRHLLQQHSEKNFKCSLCPKKFRTEKGVECHSKKHRENRPYRCDVCGKGFFREDYFAKHVSTHARDDPFQCDHCGKNFVLKKVLWTHIARCYKMKMHKCNICNKIFSSNVSLSVHKTIHTGEKNLVCEVCGKTFRRLGTLAVHRRQHTGEKPYHCDICDRSFTHRISFVNHKKRYHE